MGHRKILVLEDDADSRLLCCQALMLEGHQVESFDSGESALEWLDNCDVRPDLVLTDLSLPDMSGEEFVLRLRQKPGLGSVAIILVSGWDDISIRARALGAHGTLKKPYDLKDLYKVVLSSMS